ncbi:polyprenol phosphomannose-dependent alpha 1,6 mannosyltransferase MptB [Umezawaea sp. Da 62-37]|uniref:polyprenol phosphomannose-dependent alpha 1,6 mannosyltransferase MptB n=1 Tax=Umezawaea sp. Da 62-37 TaxID=3075927 RepID=UPI0028F6CC9E|nr:polyprenol phosphomannose-dependent alpha 1,6 mannosyltransferase MptB [Umezawaea sp. Da 62-37]WNV84279.1 polyprenol phosphomannose-dependent alpha 1,6 mannosyltransferase MptB [Umezawaea sp. Da 62-37]
MTAGGVSTSDGVTASGSGSLDAPERRQLDVIRRWGTVGALLLAVGSLGSGAAPVFSPLPGTPVLGLFVRMPSVAMGIAWTGVFMVVSAWLWLGRFVRPGRARLATRSQLDRTLLMWTMPLVFVLPMFSRDVYSYLAQSEIAARGQDPYEFGPATALGVDHPLTMNVPNIWRETPAPYGPLFLALGRVIAMLTGDHVLPGVFLHRLLALVGLGMIVWALPRLARRFGVPPVGALWLGALNPLVLFHIVIGVHNDGLAIGLMLVGLELALRKLPVVLKGVAPPPITREEVLWVALGATMIVMGAMVKIPAMLALGFLGVMVARRLGGRFPDLLRAAAFMTVVAGLVTVLTCVGTGYGFGWISTLNVASTVKSWMSPPTALGYLSGGLGITLSLGNHTESTIALARILGQVVSVLIVGTLLWKSFRGRIKAVNGLGAGLGAVLVLGPVLQPWYVLWAALPLATAVVAKRFRGFAMTTSAFIAIILPPTGSAFDGRAYVVPQAVTGAAITFVLCVLVARKQLYPLMRRDPLPSDD